MPTEGGGLGRAIAGLIGMNQERIREKVYEGAIGDFRQQIPIEAQEEGQERIAAETVKRNADLRTRGLVGNDTLEIHGPANAQLDLELTHLSLRSRPDEVLAGGVLKLRGAPREIGADAPEPVALLSPEPGINANVHLGSLLGSLASGIYERDMVRSVQNLMLVVKEVPPGTPPGEAVKVTKNVDFATFAKAVDASRKPEARHPSHDGPADHPSPGAP